MRKFGMKFLWSCRDLFGDQKRPFLGNDAAETVIYVDKKTKFGTIGCQRRDLFYGSHNPVFQRRWQPFHHSREGEEAGMLRIKAEYALNWFLMQFNLFNPKMLNMEREAPTPGTLLTEVSNQKYLLTEHPRDSNKSPKFRQRWRREQKINHK